MTRTVRALVAAVFVALLSVATVSAAPSYADPCDGHGSLGSPGICSGN